MADAPVQPRPEKLTAEAIVNALAAAGLASGPADVQFTQPIHREVGAWVTTLRLRLPDEQ